MHLPRDLKGWLKVGAVLAAVIGVYLLYKEFFPELDLQELLADVSASLGAWTYLLVAVFAFLETGAFVGLVAPGETVVVLAGAVAGQGETSVLLTIALAWLGAFCGDTASFFLGVKLGRGFIVRNGPRFGISAERFAEGRHLHRDVGYCRRTGCFKCGEQAPGGTYFRGWGPQRAHTHGFDAALWRV